MSWLCWVCSQFWTLLVSPLAAGASGYTYIDIYIYISTCFTAGVLCACARRSVRARTLSARSGSGWARGGRPGWRRAAFRRLALPARRPPLLPVPPPPLLLPPPPRHGQCLGQLLVGSPTSSFLTNASGIRIGLVAFGQMLPRDLPVPVHAVHCGATRADTVTADTVTANTVTADTVSADTVTADTVTVPHCSIFGHLLINIAVTMCSTIRPLIAQSSALIVTFSCCGVFTNMRLDGCLVICSMSALSRFCFQFHVCYIGNAGWHVLL